MGDEPVNAYVFYAYGYDPQERIIYAAFFQAEEMPRSCTFYAYGEGRIDLAEYYIQLRTDHYYLHKVARLVQPSNQYPLYYAEYSEDVGQGRQLFEEYHFDDRGRVERFISFRESQPLPLSEEAQRRMQQRTTAQLLDTEELLDTMLPQFEHVITGRQYSIHTEEIYAYEGDTLKRIVSHSLDSASPGSQTRTIYEAPRTGETDESLFEAARASLRDIIINRVVQFDSAKRQQMRVYNLVLSYDAVADDGLMLILGQEAQRQAWERETVEQCYRSLVYHQLGWQVESIEIWELPDDYERFLRTCRRDQRGDDIRSLLFRVARDLNEHNWNEILNTTGDFILYANDYEALEDVHDEILACVPEDKLQILRAKGLLD